MKPNAPGEGSELPALISTLKDCQAAIEMAIDSEHHKRPMAEGEALLARIKTELKAALSSPQQEWIDCKQKLPPLLTPVWAWDGSDSVIRILTKNGWKASMGGAVHQISHWQPYSPPAPPVTAEGKDIK